MKVSCKCGHRFDLIGWSSGGRMFVQFRDIVTGSFSFGEIVENCPACGHWLHVGEALLQGKTGSAEGQGRGSSS